MAPKKRSVEDEISRLQSKTLHLQYKSIMTEVTAMLKARPELLPSTLQHLKNISGTLSSHSSPSSSASQGSAHLVSMLPDPTGEGPKLCTPVKKARVDSSPAPKSDPSSTDAASSGEAGVSRNDIPRCYTKVGTLPPGYIQHALAQVEKISLSANAMRALCCRGQKTPGKAKLLELFEFMTGLSPEDDFPPVLHNIPLLTRSMQHYNLARGRPAREMSLPAMWASDGIYKVILPGEGDEPGAKLQVQHTILKITKPVPENFDTSGPLENIYVEKNFSERRADLVNPASCCRRNLKSLFPEADEAHFKAIELKEVEGTEGKPLPSAEDQEEQEDEEPKEEAPSKAPSVPEEEAEADDEKTAPQV